MLTIYCIVVLYCIVLGGNSNNSNNSNYSIIEMQNITKLWKIKVFIFNNNLYTKPYTFKQNEQGYKQHNRLQ